MNTKTLIFVFFAVSLFCVFSSIIETVQSSGKQPSWIVTVLRSCFFFIFQREMDRSYIQIFQKSRILGISYFRLRKGHRNKDNFSRSSIII